MILPLDCSSWKGYPLLVFSLSAMDVFALTRAFVDIESTTFHEGAMGEHLLVLLRPITENYGGELVSQPVAEGRFNILATWGKPIVTLSTHFDCVPPFFASSEDDKNLYGRGACDAKGILAAMIVAIEGLLVAGIRDIALLAVVGEERNSEGAYVAAKTNIGSKFVVNGEPTGGNLAIGSKGALRVEVKARGKAAHSAYPELGDSAIDKLLDALARIRAIPLESDETLGESTLNIGVIQGGRAPNVVADEAKAELLVRLVDDGATTFNRITEAAGPDVECHQVLRMPAVKMHAIDGFDTSVVRFTTDAGILAESWGTPLLYGPGSISVAHTPHEYVAKEALLQAVRDYQEIVTKLMEVNR